jgi:membrane protease YdiL (CAAX protease family)
MLGYILFVILLGYQATIFYLGQKYLGVWKEWFRLTQLSSSYIPFLTAFVIGSSASLNEEILFRLFGISWAKRYLKNTILAVILTSVIWGLGHSGYAIFPVWFRAIEVGLMGVLFGIIFIRYGLLPLIVAHYLLDVFWGVAAYILGSSSVYLFAGSMGILVMPLVFAAAAYFINKEEKEREIETMLDAHQRYNLDILIAFVSLKKSQGTSVQTIKEELILHEWDTSLIDLAIKEVFNIQ